MDVRAILSTCRSSAVATRRIITARIDSLAGEVLDVGATSARTVVQAAPRFLNRTNNLFLRSTGAALKGVSSSARLVLDPSNARG